MITPLSETWPMPAAAPIAIRIGEPGTSAPIRTIASEAEMRNAAAQVSAGLASIQATAIAMTAVMPSMTVRSDGPRKMLLWKT
jgi:hypothetical protein